MPFLTEELWHGLYGHTESSSISTTTAPVCDSGSIDAATEERFETLQLVVEALRRQRSEMGIPPGERLDVHLSVRAQDVDFFTSQSAIISSLGRCAALVIGIGSDVAKPDGSVSDVVRGVEIHLVVAGKIDFDKERTRLTKEIERLTGALAGVEKKLANASFVANAKPEIIEVERQKLADWTDTLEKLRRNLASI
jgi:valyl-tRNA synthetase